MSERQFHETATTAEIVLTLSDPVDSIFERLCENVRRAGWTLVLQDDLQTPDGAPVRVVFGVSSALGAMTLRGFLEEGARHVPFLVRISAGPTGGSRVRIAAAGSEKLQGDRHGRNRKVAETLARACE